MAQHGDLREYGEGWERGEERDRDPRERDRERGAGFMFEGQDFRNEGGRSFPRSTDDHYRSWRDRHMQELDRDYEEYCREREQQFHQDFSAWRQQRHGNPQPLQAGMTQSGLESDPTGILELKGDTAVGGPGDPDPMATATLGTSSSRGR
jgi:hypothetical protein